MPRSRLKWRCRRTLQHGKIVANPWPDLTDGESFADELP